MSEGNLTVEKRDGRVVSYDKEKIQRAIFNCLKAGGHPDPSGCSASLAGEVDTEIQKEMRDSPLFPSFPISVENIQDLVEKTLMEAGLHDFAKRYILYRQQRSEVREVRNLLGIGMDDWKLSPEALSILKERYLLKDQEGQVIETPKQMLQRVARAVAQAEEPSQREKWEREFFDLIGGNGTIYFFPSSPILFNAGTEIGQLAACFVIPIPDSLDGISKSLTDMAKVQQTGGGTGFSFSQLRPKGDIVRTTFGTASGPASFIFVHNEYTEQIKQGGRRRGANIGILLIDHPDIEEFISLKANGTSLQNFNLSIAITDKFMECLGKEEDSFQLINPRTKVVVKVVHARTLWEKIVQQAWKTGDPGLIFIDSINKDNPLPSLGRIEATNPCGEAPLFPYESCVLGSMNLLAFGPGLDTKKLKEKVTLAVRFLDDVITVNKFPTKEIEKATKLTRKIGLGLMGFHDFLISLGIPYDSDEALDKAKEVMGIIHYASLFASMDLGKEKGSFPAFSKYEREGEGTTLFLRNATRTTIAPTGTISILVGVSGAIEPNFAYFWKRRVIGGLDYEKFHPLLMGRFQEKGISEDPAILQMLRATGSIQGVEDERITPKEKAVFKTALEISPDWQVRMQGVFQKETDSAVSKTVNLPENATEQDIDRIFKLAYFQGCKGITAYRDKSRKGQIISVGEGND